MMILSIVTPTALLLLAAVAFPGFRKVLGLVLGLVIVAVVVLLALSSSNEDFQRLIDWTFTAKK
jgi:hypothetical protein